MTEAEELAEAYFTLGMKPGGSKDAVHSRWKRLAMVWHSDRFTSTTSKQEADEELKNINNARDILKKHFETSHKESGSCACNASSAGSAGPAKQPGGTGQGPGPGKRRTTQETDKQEADAARRTKERAERAAKDAAEKDAQSAKAAAEASAADKSKQQAEITVITEGEKLRWKIALCMAAAWIVLSIFAFCITGTKVWWTHLTEKWKQEQQWKTDDDNQKKAAQEAAAAQQREEDAQAQAAQKQRDADDQKRKNESIDRARASIKLQQDIIDHCTSELAKAKTQLDDPNVSYGEKLKLQDWQRQQQNYLSTAQANYNMAQQELADLTATKAPPPIGGNTDTPVPHIDSSFSRPPVDFRTIAPSTDQPPVQKFSTPHWTPSNYSEQLK
jgi:curved DNA-binding protein CbpA